MSRALVTGVAGFTGKYLVHELTAQGHDVFGIGIEPRPDIPALRAYRQLDLMDVRALDMALADLTPNLVFHLAGMSHVTRDSAEALYRVNIMATRHLLDGLARLDHAPSRVLLASTANLYGNQSGTLDETTVPAPTNDYAVSKLAMEHMAALFRDRLPITIVRPFNYTGRGQSVNFLVPKLVHHFKHRLPTIELGNIDVVRDFSDVRDIATAYVRLAQATDPGWGPFNLCSGVGQSLRGILDLLRRLTGHSPKLEINPAFVRKGDVNTLIGSRARLVATVGALETIPFETTLDWMLETPR
ncbi:MAG: NAD-dependent epimerase/dehydratase family protein [Myxococcales bacterium]|jgi:nucleoside-diphosphate-sugar epimerase|nr:NAD-dependent epimerase/dehydratase family protein [Myxococcales bacterium]